MVSALAIILIFFKLAANLFAGTSDFLEKMTEAQSQISIFQQSVGCDIQTSNWLDEHFGGTGTTVFNYWKKHSCSELFSAVPPSWMSRVEWFPVCSSGILASAVQRGARSILVLRSEYEKEIHRYDTCEVLGDYVGKSGKSGTSSAHSNPKSRELLASRRREINLIAQKTHIALTSACCPEGLVKRDRCLQLMSDAKISWCTPGVELNCDSTGLGLTRWASRFGVAAGPIESSEVRLPAIEMDAWDSDDTAAALVAHELAHACTTIRFHQALGGDLNKHKNFLRNDCAISNETLKNYRELFLSTGANREVFDCVVGLAQASTKRRFENRECNGCPKAQLFESFGDWMAIKATPSFFRGPALIQRQCNRWRDSVHPLGPDKVRCFMKSGSIRKNIKDDIGCQGPF